MNIHSVHRAVDVRLTTAHDSRIMYKDVYPFIYICMVISKTTDSPYNSLQKYLILFVYIHSNINEDFMQLMS